MTAALLTVKIEIANFDALTATTMPFNLRIGTFHINRSSQRPPVTCARGIKKYAKFGF